MMSFIQGFTEGLKETPGYLASFAFLAGGVYLLLFSASTALKHVGVILLLIGAILLAHMTGYSRGAAGARAECHEADVQAELAKTKEELAIQQDTSLDAAKRAARIAGSAAVLQQKVTAYEESLSKRDVCALTSDDITGLRSITTGQPKARRRHPG